MQEPSKKEFEAIVKNTPNLCMSGLVDDGYCKQFKIDPILNKKDLLNCFKEFKLCCEWLSRCKQTKIVTNNAPGSYGLKHMIEFHFKTYISNGAVISAVMFLGIPYKIDPDPPNITVGISKKCPFYMEHLVH